MIKKTEELKNGMNCWPDGQQSRRLRCLQDKRLHVWAVCEVVGGVGGKLIDLLLLLLYLLIHLLFIKWLITRSIRNLKKYSKKFQQVLKKIQKYSKKIQQIIFKSWALHLTILTSWQKYLPPNWAPMPSFWVISNTLPSSSTSLNALPRSLPVVCKEFWVRERKYIIRFSLKFVEGYLEGYEC